MEPLVFEHLSLPPSAATPPTRVAPVMDARKRPTLAALFESEESGLLGFAMGLVRRRSIAEELVQETFLRLHQVRDDVENPRGWLYRSLRNLALNHLRDRPAEAELNEETAPHDASPAPELLERQEAVGMMRLLLAEMPDEDRTLVRLKYHDDLKYQEISQKTGLSVSNVGYRLHHVLKGLAESLRRAGIEGSQG